MIGRFAWRKIRILPNLSSSSAPPRYNPTLLFFSFWESRMKTAMNSAPATSLWLVPTRSSSRDRSTTSLAVTPLCQDEVKNLLSGVLRAVSRLTTSSKWFSRQEEVTYSYFADPMYVFMELNITSSKSKPRTWSMRSVSGRWSGLRSSFLRRQGHSVELPNSVVREVIYTEPVSRATPPARFEAGPPGYRFELPFRLRQHRATRSKSTPAPTSTRAAPVIRDFLVGSIGQLRLPDFISGHQLRNALQRS